MAPDPASITAAALLLLIGAGMVVDPEGFATIPSQFATAVRNFEERNERWKRQWRTTNRPEPNEERSRWIRIGGCAIIAIGLAIIATTA